VLIVEGDGGASGFHLRLHRGTWGNRDGANSVLKINQHEMRTGKRTIGSTNSEN
jgi:hypothetical protein